MLTTASLTLVLGATGKTGSRVAYRLLSRGLPVRTAARSGADAHLSAYGTDSASPENEWVTGAVAAGVPAEYGAMLRVLTETIASGNGSRPSSDVAKATGVAPASFADFARRTAAAWAVGEAR